MIEYLRETIQGMSNTIHNYYETLCQSVPIDIYVGLLALFCIGLVTLLLFRGFKKGTKQALWLLAGEYLVIILCSTVYFRPYRENVGFNFKLFWSYSAIQEGRIDLIPETVMNVVVFMPIGVVLSCLSPRIKWWMVLLIGIGFSVLIEALQFFLKRGFAEFDDVFHNMLGCLLGIMIVEIIKGFWQFCSYLFVPQWGRSPKDVGTTEI